MNNERAPRGIVFDIAHNSMQDGPGIRTVVFLKGCPLRCAWCHNPESCTTAPLLSVRGELCIACGRCAAVCPCHRIAPDGAHDFNRENCTACGRCVSVCPENALSLVGREMDVETVMRAVRQDKVFYEVSGGGMTISGGEPLFQPEFTCALARAASAEGISVCLETSGFGSTAGLDACLPFVDWFLFDWKVTDPNVHRRMTGGEQAPILSGLQHISAAGARIELRCPIIPSVNAEEAHLCGIAALANHTPGVARIQLEPYHALGQGKAASLGIAQRRFTPPTKEEMQTYAAVLRRKTDIPVLLA